MKVGKLLFSKAKLFLLHKLAKQYRYRTVFRLNEMKKGRSRTAFFYD